MKALNLTGQKFGRLVVIKRVENNKQKRIQWLCKCDCGNEKIVSSTNLRTGKTKSCGCLRRDKNHLRFSLPLGLASMRIVINNYKQRAKKRGYEYNLTEEQFEEITQQPCYYCGAKPDNVKKQQYCNGAYIYNGIDRVDNAKGYTTDNVVPCCKTCNSAKGQLTMQEFKNWIDQICLFKYKGV